MQHTILSLTILTCGTLAGAAQGQNVLEDIDTDGDGQISSEEWTAYRENAGTEEVDLWSAYDADASGAISEEEYAAAEFDRYDINADSLLDETEFQSRIATMPPLLGESADTTIDAEPSADASGGDDQVAEISGYAQGLADYDQDGDALLNPGEFWAILSGDQQDDRGAYAAYDENDDSQVTPAEFGRGEFRRFDWNDDGMLSEEEFTRYREGQSAKQ